MMTEKKLTEAQKKALQLVADGKVYYNPMRYVFINSETGQTVMAVRALNLRGLVKAQVKTFGEFNRHRAFLTDAGREALNGVSK